MLICRHRAAARGLCEADMNSPSSLDPSAILDRILSAAAQNLRIEKILLQLGLDPSNVTFEAVVNWL